MIIQALSTFHQAVWWGSSSDTYGTRLFILPGQEMPQQLLDEQAQKVRESLHMALINWARAAGEAGDYTDNIPLQCLHPVGHWFEIPNLLRNGTLLRLLEETA